MINSTLKGKKKKSLRYVRFISWSISIVSSIIYLTKCLLARRTSVTGFITKVKQEADAALGDMVILEVPFNSLSCHRIMMSSERLTWEEIKKIGGWGGGGFTIPHFIWSCPRLCSYNHALNTFEPCGITNSAIRPLERQMFDENMSNASVLLVCECECGETETSEDLLP